ncbi:siderophore ABC transporter substrate-binding protein [Macrococcus equi]|uniref:siderophore ABC transporter substrate-binding protein n=1 Tax=Macrococcus equi TaxID=3395462 RepID=UPI0039BDDE36
MKRISVFLIALLVMFTVAACGNKETKKETESKDTNSESASTIEVERTYLKYGTKPDGSDSKEVTEKVKVPVNPKKVVVFDYGTLTTIKDLKVEDKVVGLPKGENNSSLPKFLSDFKDNKYENLGNMKEPNFEKIAEISPDLILINGRQANTKVLDELKKAAPDASVLYSAPQNDRYIDSVKENTETLGKIFGKEKEAKDLNKKLDDKIASAKVKISKAKEKALFLLVNEGELSVFGPKGRYGFLYEDLGVKTADKDIKPDTGHGQPVNFEYLNAKNPDLIFAMDRGVAVGGKATSKQTLSNDVVKKVNAVKNDKIVDFDPFLWYLAGGSPTTTIQQIEQVEAAYK